jgi:hypothetical protein
VRLNRTGNVDGLAIAVARVDRGHASAPVARSQCRS